MMSHENALKKQLRFYAVSIFILLNLLIGVNAKPDIAEIEKGVVRVVTYTEHGEGTGTGFIVNNDTVIVTNYHVVDGGDEFAIVPSGSSDLISAEVIKRFPELDLAFLKTSPLNRKPVQLSSAIMTKGDDVWSMGFPGIADRLGDAVEASLTDGTVSRLFSGKWFPGAQGIKLIQHSAAINPGNSGGPLFDDCGRVIGVNTQGSGSGRIVRDGNGDVIDVMAGVAVYFASNISETIRELKNSGIELEEVSDACITDTGTAQAQKAQEDASRAQSQANQAEEAARQAEERAKAADSAASEAVDQAKLAEDEAKKAKEEAEENKKQLEHFIKKAVSWFIGLGLLVLITLGFALRKPRREIIKVVEKYSRKITRLTSRSETSTPSRSLILSGFDQQGHAFRIVILPKQLINGYGYSLGRHPSINERAIEDEDLSRRHCRFSWKNKHYYIEDLNSSNGSVVNSQSIRSFQKMELHSGDVIKLGNIEMNVNME